MMKKYAAAFCASAAILAACTTRENPSALPAAAQQLALTKSFHVVYQFTHRAFPKTGLVAVKGVLYGTTPVGGGPGYGTVYSVTTAGVRTNIYAFKGHSDGAQPEAGLIAVNGTLYGTTHAGGGTGCPGGGCGTVYSVSPSGKEEVLHRFAGGADGSYPVAGLVDVNGTLYGTTFEGGSGTCSNHGHGQGCGTVFRVTTSGSETVLYNFTGQSDGWFPEAGLIAVKGTLYGTTFFGGADAEGTVFRMTTAGAKRVLHSFGAGADGANPQAPLIDVNGTLYGTTLRGGASGLGTVFSVPAKGGEEAQLHSFSGTPDGQGPIGGLADVTGALYGTTFAGGSAGKGSLYRIGTTGAESVVHSFTGGANGSNPQASPIDVNGTLYGTTAGGGYGHGFGTVYALTP